VFREVRGSLAGIPFEGQSHALNVLDNLGIRLTPKFCCERSYIHAVTTQFLHVLSSHSTAMLGALVSSNATLGCSDAKSSPNRRSVPVALTSL